MSNEDMAYFFKHKAEISTLIEMIAHLEQQNQEISRQQYALKELLNELAVPVKETSGQTREDIAYQIITSVTGILAFIKKPLTLKTICELLEENNLIPVQILNAQTFINRRLEREVQAGKLVLRCYGGETRRRFSLPEWHDAGGELLEGFQI